MLIISEMTDSRAMILPLVATAIIADGVSALVCRERLYHGLAKGFRGASEPAGAGGADGLGRRQIVPATNSTISTIAFDRA